MTLERGRFIFQQAPTPICRSLFVISLCLAIFLGPFALIVGGNIGGAVLNLLLNRTPTLSELVGDYTLDAPWGKSKLQIKSDGTFNEEVFEGDKLQRTARGHWTQEVAENSLALDFRPFGMVWDADHNREINIYGINFYKPHFGPTYGMIDDDLGERYEREDGD